MIKNGNDNRRVVFTVVANNYLPYARVLMRSVREHSEDVRCVIFLCDRKQHDHQLIYNEIESEVELIDIEDISINDFARMAFCYSLIELCTAVKPFCFNWLLNSGAENIIYLDPDIKTYASLNTVFECTETHNIVLTPHLTKPVSDSKRPNETDILRVGTYNLGFIAVRNSAETDKFIDWWSGRLSQHCIVAPEKGLFVDQRWIDLVPGLFDGVLINKNPGLNVAYWNLDGRAISQDNETLFSNNHPLIFVHYSGINAKTNTFSHHQNRHSLSNLPKRFSLLAKEYIEELNSLNTVKKAPVYAYSVFSNGQTISYDVRQAFRNSADAFEISKPVQDDPGFLKKLVKLLNTAETDPMSSAPNPLITRLTHQIYQNREDLRQRFPDLFEKDAAAFTEWLVISNESNRKLPTDCHTRIEQQLALYNQKHGKQSSTGVLTVYHKTPLLKKLILRYTSEKTRKRLLFLLNKK